MNALKTHPIIEQYIQWNQFGKEMGMDFTIHQPGRVDYIMKINKNHLATPVAAHGGSIAALIDAALGVACLSMVCEEGKVVSTVNLNIHYMKPGILEDTIIARAHVINKGKRILTASCELYNQKEELIATASATMNAYPVAKLGFTY